MSKMDGMIKLSWLMKKYFCGYSWLNSTCESLMNPEYSEDLPNIIKFVKSSSMVSQKY